LGVDVSFSREEPFRFAARYVAHDGALDPRIANTLLADFGAKPLLG